MAAKRARINIYLPAVNRFPELKQQWNREQHQPQESFASLLVKRSAGSKSDPSAVQDVTAGAIEEDHGLEGSGRSLYVIDSHGYMLEHVRYQGNDYRGALRAAISARPKVWKE